MSDKGEVERLISMKPCEHLEHAMMATENCIRVCQSCQIERLTQALKSQREVLEAENARPEAKKLSDAKWGTKEIDRLHEKITDLEKRLAEAGAERDYLKSNVWKDIEAFNKQEARLKQLEAELERVKEANKTICDKALTAFAGTIATPEEGYNKAPLSHLVSDIKKVAEMADKCKANLTPSPDDEESKK